MKTIVNSAVVGWTFATAVFTSVISYAYYIAYQLHTTGSELIKYFVN